MDRGSWIQKKFQVSEHITLKLEESRTNIYVAGQLFLQCKYLLLNIYPNDEEDYDDIDSIDEVADLLDHSMEETSSEFKIPPETEFWGHCSNIQAWVENRYDSRLLHSNLAFPLLKRLTEVGDSVAKGVFQEEICKRFESYNPSTMVYLLANQFIRFLTDEQKKELLIRWMKEDLESAIVMLIGNSYMNEFGEKYQPMLLQNLSKDLNRREEDLLEREYPRFLEEFGLASPHDFVVQLLSERNILAEIFDKYRYPIPDDNDENGIDYTHLTILKKVYRELYALELKDKQYREVIIKQLKGLFESSNPEIIAALLLQEFYNLIPLTMFKKWIIRADALFVEGLFKFYGNEKLMTYYAPYQIPYHFLFSYLDDEGLQAIVQHLNKLPFLYRRSVLDGIVKGIGNRSFQKDILRLVKLVFSELELKISVDLIRPIDYKIEHHRMTLENPDEIVIENSNIQLIITRPQAKIFTHHQEGGFTRIELFSLIYDAYSTIYQENFQLKGEDHIYSVYLEDIYLIGIYHDPITHDVWVFSTRRKHINR